MEFEYTSSIYIDEQDLEEMTNRVKQGEELGDIYYDIMASYEDQDYYSCYLIIDQVREEIERIIN